MIERVHLLISGEVTRVGYRYWAVVNAKKLGLVGFVRNADRGLVEAVFEGNEEKVKEMIARCKKGPQVSYVKKVEVKSEEARGEFLDFEVRY